jgi:hypothetical protein
MNMHGALSRLRPVGDLFQVSVRQRSDADLPQVRADVGAEVDILLGCPTMTTP